MCKQVIPYSKQYRPQNGTYNSEMHEENREESVPSRITAGGSDAVKILPTCVAAHWQGLQFYFYSFSQNNRAKQWEEKGDRVRAAVLWENYGHEFGTKHTGKGN